MRSYSPQEKDSFDKAPERLQKAYKNIQEEKAPPSTTKYVGFSDPVTIPNLNRKVSEWLKEKDQ